MHRKARQRLLTLARFTIAVQLFKHVRTGSLPSVCRPNCTSTAAQRPDEELRRATLCQRRVWGLSASIQKATTVKRKSLREKRIASTRCYGGLRVQRGQNLRQSSWLRIRHVLTDHNATKRDAQRLLTRFMCRQCARGTVV
jgi:hypothetical protein